MRIKVQLTGTGAILLPAGFGEYIQALIYAHLNPDSGEWLHDGGFRFEKRSFKLFCFSSILEKGKFNKGIRVFEFPSAISVLVSSPVDWILEQLAGNLIKSERVRLGSNTLTISSVEIMKNGVLETGAMKVKALTPVEAHSTFTIESGKKKTHYYTPFEEEFSNLVCGNLKKKWQAFYNKECPHSLSVKPLFHGNANERILYFGAGEKRTLVKGWKGRFLLEGDAALISFALDAGLGARNSQGFGMVEAAE